MNDELARKTVTPLATASSKSAGPGELARNEITREFLAFELGGEHYALPLSSIREILMPLPITGVPRSASDILGIISVRGRITTVVDLRRRLNVEEAPESRASRILLADRGDEVIGVLVDRVVQVYRLDPEEIEYSSVTGTDGSDHFMGIGRPRANTRGSTTLESEGAILILLDPIPLLRR